MPKNEKKKNEAREETGAHTSFHRSNILIVSGEIDMEDEKQKVVNAKKKQIKINQARKEMGAHTSSHRSNDQLHEILTTPAESTKHEITITS